MLTIISLSWKMLECKTKLPSKMQNILMHDVTSLVMPAYHPLERATLCHGTIMSAMHMKSFLRSI